MGEYINVDVNGNDESDSPYLSYMEDLTGHYSLDDDDFIKSIAEAYVEVLDR